MINIDRSIIEDAMYDAGLDEHAVRLDYSGRGMYGAQCIGIVGSPGDAIAFAIALAERDDDFAYEARNASMDSMGLDSITYWRNVQAEAEVTA